MLFNKLIILKVFYGGYKGIPVIVIPAGPAIGKATPGNILLINEFTLLKDALAVERATGLSGILKLKN